MTDRTIVNRIKQLAPAASFVFHGNRCTEARFTSQEDIYFGVIRHHSSSDKARILQLLSELQALTRLDLRKNRLGPLPSCLGRLSRLTHLDLASNYMAEVPEWLENLQELTFLNLGVNELEVLPDYLGKFKKMTVLKLHKNCRVSRLPDLSQMSELRFLNLFLLPKIDFIPPCFHSFSKLEFFSCGVSCIEKLPEDLFVRWPRLVWLSIVNTKIKSLPENLCQLKRLQGLRLPKNRLRELPNNIGALTQLEYLSVYRNELRRLPASITKLRNLKILNIARNPFDRLDTPPIQGVRS